MLCRCVIMKVCKLYGWKDEGEREGEGAGTSYLLKLSEGAPY